MSEEKKLPPTSVEVEAKTVALAIKEALETLQATEKEVTIEVLKEEQKGLFGMQGAEPAKVRVALEKPPPVEDPGKRSGSPKDLNNTA